MPNAVETCSIEVANYNEIPIICKRCIPNAPAWYAHSIKLVISRLYCMLCINVCVARLINNS